MRSTYGIYNIQNTNCKNGMVSHLTASHSCTLENQVQVLVLLLHLHATPAERIGLSEKRENPEKFRKQAPHAEKSRKMFDFEDISPNIALHFSPFINNYITTHKIIEQIILPTQEKLTADFNQDIYKHPRTLTSISLRVENVKANASLHLLLQHQKNKTLKIGFL